MRFDLITEVTLVPKDERLPLRGFEGNASLKEAMDRLRFHYPNRHIEIHFPHRKPGCESL